MTYVAKRLGLLFACWLLAASAATAQLYAPPISTKAAFIRVVNLSQHADITLNSTSLQLSALSVSDYYVTENGLVTLRFGDVNQSKTLTAGQYYTMIVQDNTVSWFTDPSPIDPLKAVIALYNATAENDIVFTAQTGERLVDLALAGSLHHLEVNPMQLSISALHEKTAIAEQPIMLQRRIVSSLFLVKAPDGYHLLSHSGQVSAAPAIQ